VRSVGPWRSLVAHLNGVQGVAGSNPVGPTSLESSIKSSGYEGSPADACGGSRGAPEEHRNMRSQTRRLRLGRIAWLAALSMSAFPQHVGAVPGHAGRGAPVALRSVARVFCPAFGSVGSGFLHKSGRVITAAHVVEREIEGAGPPSFEACPALLLITPTSGIIPITVTALDRDLDLALLTLARPLKEQSLTIASAASFELGALVSAWGFPAGYNGEVALLTVGNLAGVDDIPASSGKMAQRQLGRPRHGRNDRRGDWRRLKQARAPTGRNARGS
jgi:S1-C subfamily serine protease